MKPTFIFLLLVFSFASCQLLQEGEPILPKATGKVGGILIVADKPLWQQEIVTSIKEVLSKPAEGIAQKETLFKLSTAPSSIYFKSLKTYRTILIPIILDYPYNYFTPFTTGLSKDVIEKVEANGTILQKAVNKYAKEQTIVYLIAKNEKSLCTYVKENAKSLRHYFHQREINTLIGQLEREKTNKEAMKRIEEKFSYHMHIPSTFQMALDTTDFVWLRQAEANKDLNIIIAEVKPEEISFVNESIFGYRNQLCKRYIYGNKERENSYMTTESIIMPYFEDSKLNDAYAKECRGLWKLKNLSMGGTFISYTLKNKDKKYFYIEAFLHNPAQKKVPELRNLEAILRTFKPM